MIDLKRGASSLGQMCSNRHGDLFCGGKGSLSTVEFSILKNATTHLQNHLQCDASNVFSQITTHIMKPYFSLSLQLREPDLFSKKHFSSLSLLRNIQQKQDLLVFVSVEKSNKIG